MIGVFFPVPDVDGVGGTSIVDGDGLIDPFRFKVVKIDLMYSS